MILYVDKTSLRLAQRSEAFRNVTSSEVEMSRQATEKLLINKFSTGSGSRLRSN